MDRVSTRSRGGKGIVDDGKGRKKFLISGYMTEITVWYIIGPTKK